MTIGGGRRRRQWKTCVDTCMSWLKLQNSANNKEEEEEEDGRKRKEGTQVSLTCYYIQ